MTKAITHSYQPVAINSESISQAKHSAAKINALFVATFLFAIGGAVGTAFLCQCAYSYGAGATFYSFLGGIVLTAAGTMYLGSRVNKLSNENDPFHTEEDYD